jgi:hypothetical protein
MKKHQERLSSNASPRLTSVEKLYIQLCSENFMRSSRPKFQAIVQFLRRRIHSGTTPDLTSHCGEAETAILGEAMKACSI